MRRKSELELFSSPSLLSESSRFYLVGIGGAGMSALARMLQHRSIPVAGCDAQASAVTRSLEELGIKVAIPAGDSAISPGMSLVLSDAIDLDTSPEVAAARKLGLPIFRRSQVMAWILRDKKVICVTGTHGKTTTTAMAGLGLLAAGMDPTIVVGAEVSEFNGSVREGQSEWAVVEACEAYDSFRDLKPFGVILTNLEPDHLDYHGTWESLRDSVKSFLSTVPQDGFIVVGEDKGALEAAAGFEATQYQESTWESLSGGTEIKVMGGHNRMNAGGALSACIKAGAGPGRAIEGIRAFGGAERRLQVYAEEPVAVVDDYAHMPAEVSAGISALREKFPGRRLIVVFQPHLYSRTAENISEFAVALSGADEVIITDIYPAREAPMPGVSAVRIAEGIKSIPHQYVPSRHHLARIIASQVKAGDVVCAMGAGSIGELASELLLELQRAEKKPLVMVVSGGESSEREVSLHSGNATAAAVERLGYPLLRMDPTELLNGRQSLASLYGPMRPACALLPIHGQGAEDGALQGLLELLHIPYCGSGILASALSIDKQKTKDILALHGIDVPRGIQVSHSDLSGSMNALEGFSSAVVKPNREGSTVGLSFVERKEDLLPAVQRALKYDESCLVEEWLVGIEISCPVLGDRALLPVEIVPKHGRYDFANKYTPGASHEPCPPPSLSEEQIELSRKIALSVHKALGCRGLTRTDMIVVGDRIVALEINTLPGMTETSLVRISAAAMGMSFDQLVDWMIQYALSQKSS